MTLSVWQASPQELFPSWACAILSLTVAVSFFERCHKRGIMDSQCVFATGCPRRCRKPGIGTEVRVQQYSDTRIERGYYTACADPWLSHCSFSPQSSFSSRHHGRITTSLSQERLARRLCSCPSYGCRGTRRPRRFVSSSADVTAVARATNIYMKLRETSTPKTRRLRPSAELQFGLTCKGRTLSWISKNSHKLHDSFSPVESLFKI